MASSSEQLSVVEKIVGDEDNDYDDDEDSEGDELQSSDEVSIASVIESGVISDNNQHGTAGSHGNDELIAPAADSSLNTRSRTLLDCLHRPTASELARKRKVDKNPPKGKKKSRGSCVSNPKTITPQQRVNQYKNEFFSVSNKKLFCQACRDELSVKSSIIAAHIKSAKHSNGKVRLMSQKSREKEIAEALKEQDSTLHPKGESLPDEQRIYRVKVVRNFLSAGVPLNKIPLFRELLEENGFRLTDRRRMSDLVPFILSQEKGGLKRDLAGKCLSIIFDGTTRLGEIFVVVVRFVAPDWCIYQKLIRVQMLAKSLCGEEIAREIIYVLSVEYGVMSQQILAVMHDCASTNTVAMHTLSVLYPMALDIGCFSHTLDRVGDRFDVPTLYCFMIHWISLFSHSPKAKLFWRQRTGISIQGYSATRWWSKWEVINQTFELFGDVEAFIRQDEEFSNVTRTKLAEFFSDKQKFDCLKVEFAAIVDAGN